MISFVNGKIIPIFLNAKKFIPKLYIKTFFDIDFDKLYENGKKIILIDLDNTLISYKEDMPDEKLKKHLLGLKKRFKIILVSNNRRTRVEPFANEVDLPFVYSSKKPRRKGLKKALKKLDQKYKKEEILLIGDQIMTDVWAGNRFKIDVILLDAIDKKTEKWYTRFTRKIEVGVLKKIKRKYSYEYNSLRLGEKK